jgi:hypothetical protein
MTPQLTAALAAGHYLHWGVINVSLTNLTVILVMIAVFVAALLVPFPHRGDDGLEPHVPAPGDRP